MKKMIAGVIAVAALAVSVQAEVTFSDDFNRADTASPNGGLASSDYVTVGDFCLSDGVAVHDNNSKMVMGLYADGELGTNWTLSVDAAALSSGSSVQGNRYIGAVWNYKDSKNYYVFRVQVLEAGAKWQFLEYNDGAPKTFAAGDVGSALSFDTAYTVSIKSGGSDGTFAFALLDQSLNALVEGTVSDKSGSATLTGGRAGFYSENTHSEFDNLKIAGL